MGFELGGRGGSTNAFSKDRGRSSGLSVKALRFGAFRDDWTSMMIGKSMGTLSRLKKQHNKFNNNKFKIFRITANICETHN